MSAKSEFRAIFDQLYGMLRACPRAERAGAEWVMSDLELRHIDRLGCEAFVSWNLDIFKPRLFGKPVRLEESARGVALIPGRGGAS